MTNCNSKGASHGILLGFLNTLFISIGVCTYTRDGLGVGIFIFMFGILPGLITGTALGAMANATARLDVWLRRAILCAPAVGVLLGLAKVFGVTSLFVPAVIPTIVCALILERATRYVAPVPLASAR